MYIISNIESCVFVSSDTSDESDLNLWNMVRVINILIMVRLLRIIWHIKVRFAKKEEEKTATKNECFLMIKLENLFPKTILQKVFICRFPQKVLFSFYRSYAWRTIKHVLHFIF